MSSRKKWFVSHPSGGMQHTPTFFNAVNTFAAEQDSVELVYPHDEEGDVQLTKDSISSCDLVIVEVSIPSTGSGIELGWANASGKPILAFHQGGSEPSPAIKFVTQDLKVYVTEEHIIEALRAMV